MVTLVLNTLVNSKLLRSSHKKKMVWIYQVTFHSKCFLYLTVTAPRVVCSGCYSRTCVVLWACRKGKPCCLGPRFYNQGAAPCEGGCKHVPFRGEAVFRNPCLLFQLPPPPPLLLPTYQLFLASKLLVRLLSKPDALNDAFTIHKLARGQVARQEMEYCMEKQLQIKMHHIVMIYQSASWAKCQSDWHLTHAKLPQIGIRAMHK